MKENTTNQNNYLEDSYDEWNSRNIKIEVGKRLRELRRERGLKQEDVAKFIGITRASLSYYEKGERSIDIEVLYRLSIFFQISIDYLFGLSDKIPPQREHAEVNEVSRLGFSLETMSKLWTSKALVSLIDNFVRHPDFEEFEELTYKTEHTPFDRMDINYRSFLTCHLLYSIVSDILDDYYKNINDNKIKSLSNKEKLSLLSDIEKYLHAENERNKLLKAGEITPEYIKYDSNIHNNLISIYEMLNNYI